MVRNAAIVLTHLIVYAALSFSILQYLRGRQAKRSLQVETFVLITSATILSLSYSIGLLPAPWWLPLVGLLLFSIAMHGFVYSVTKYIPLAAFIWSQALSFSALVLVFLSPFLLDSARDNGWTETSQMILSALLWVVVPGLLVSAMIVAVRASWRHRDRQWMRWPQDG